MGYYTHFSLHTDADFDVQKDITKWLAEHVSELECTKEFLAETLKDVDPINYLVTWEEMKWYDHMDDMQALAAAFPQYQFVLEGEGEERDDIWREYYKGDQFICSTARIVFDCPEWIII